MKVSIITVTFNSAKTLVHSLDSIASQTFDSIEHIIIDGGSTDGTMDIINRYRDKLAVVVSEPDKGIYDAINKGLRSATGDIIGILNSDDVLADDTTIETIVHKMDETNADVAHGDLLYCTDTSKMETVVRYWRSNIFRPKTLKWGWMPPHPTLYVRKKIYDEIGNYDISFHISADYDFILRLFTKPYHSVYIPNVLVKMSTGGVSNRDIYAMCRKSREDYRAMRQNNVGGIFTLVFKNLRKIYQFFRNA
jgi:glycosyltransferase